MYCIFCNKTKLIINCEGCDEYICDDCLFIVDTNDIYYHELVDVPLCPKNICINNYLKCYKINQVKLYENELKNDKNNESIINLLKNLKLDILKLN